MHVRKNDKVVVISGNDKNKQGEVVAVDPKKGRVIVKGLNMVTKHMKANKNSMKSEIIQTEAPMDASNVMLWCDKCNKGVRPSYKYAEDGSKVRYCKACGSEI